MRRYIFFTVLISTPENEKWYCPLKSHIDEEKEKENYRNLCSIVFLNLLQTGCCILIPIYVYDL